MYEVQRGKFQPCFGKTKLQIQYMDTDSFVLILKTDRKKDCIALGFVKDDIDSGELDSSN